MARDSLNAPLGLEPPPKPRDVPWFALALSGLILVVGSLGVFSYVADKQPPYIANQAQVAPVTTLRVQSVLDMPDANARVAAAQPELDDVTGSVGRNTAAPARPNTAQGISARDIEAQSGVRVNRQPGTEAVGLIIPVPQQEMTIRLPVTPDKKLLERGKFGNLPRIGADGTRPADAYARPVVAPGTLKSGAPRIAIMVGGMGINAGATQAAIDRLPDAITLAFAPYGSDLEGQAGHARDKGHEVVLQLPMEPFDQADIPGPHTLMTDVPSEQTLENLHWLMSRFSGYAGVANFLGSRLTSQSNVLTPVMRDIASRGLFYVEDGSSTQSVAMDVAGSVALPAVRADVILDSAKPDLMEAALTRLEVLARKNGRAFGVANGLPGTVERLTRFARGLEGRGVLLVPVSALAGQVTASSANLSR